MKRLLTAHVNGQAFPARPGDVLLDAALTSGVDIPHECRSGQCGTCRVRVGDGRVLGGRAGDGFVHACQARLLSDVDVQFDEVPVAAQVQGTLTEVRDIAAGVVEAVVRLARPLTLLPGQYVDVAFAGYPSRAYSPTAALDAVPRPGELRFHIKRVVDGAVSPRLGFEIAVGHAVAITGPFGSAFLRAGGTQRLVLIASGTGFAPIWAIADAALREWPARPLVVVAGARTIETLYMAPALQLLSMCPNVALVVTTREPQSYAQVVRQGPVEAHLPPISASDIVHVAGAPALVGAVARIADAAGAELHADAFEPAGGAGSGFVEMLRRSLRQAAGDGKPTQGREHRPAHQRPPLRLELDERDVRT